ncbi:hypothetical protein V1509DRAFT_143365 [Lipomyces kononenkoae]
MVDRDGIRTHPCVHGGDENRYKCILPEQWKQDTLIQRQRMPTGTPTPGENTRVTDIAEKFSHITQMMGTELINRHHVITTELGCWKSSLKSTVATVGSI